MRFGPHTFSRISMRRSRSSVRHRRSAPRLEALETRLVLSTLTVTSSADSGLGSLRAAIAAAGSGDTIVFASRLGGRTIRLTGGELAINQSLTIKGPGAGMLDVDAGGSSRDFDITSASATVLISGLTISGGNSEDGGGLLDQGGALLLKNDVFSHNQAVGVQPGDTAEGGGVAITNSGSLSVWNTTFDHNLAQGAVGADGGTDFINGQGGDGDGARSSRTPGRASSSRAAHFVSTRRSAERAAVAAMAASGPKTTSAGTPTERPYTQSAIRSTSQTACSHMTCRKGAPAESPRMTSLMMRAAGGAANGSVAIFSFATTSTSILNGDSFSGEQAIGGAGAINNDPTYSATGGFGGNATAVISDFTDLSVASCTFSNNVAQGVRVGMVATVPSTGVREATTLVR